MSMRWMGRLGTEWMVVITLISYLGRLTDACPPGLVYHDGFGCYAILGEYFADQAAAADGCATLDAQLASIETMDELGLVLNLIAPYSDAFLVSGYYDETTAQWKWGTGEILPQNSPLWTRDNPDRDVPPDAPPYIVRIEKPRHGLYGFIDGMSPIPAICEADRYLVFHPWSSGVWGNAQASLNDLDPTTCVTTVQDDLLTHTMLIANTSSYNELEFTLHTRNIKTALPVCPVPNEDGKLLVLTHSATTHMGKGNCKPFCLGTQACYVTQTERNRTTLREKHTLLCRCHGGKCTDLALWFPEGAAVDHVVPMEICEVRMKYIKL